MDNSKETVKRLSAPLKEFEGQIKKVTAILTPHTRLLATRFRISLSRFYIVPVVQGIIAEELAAKDIFEAEAFAIPD